VTIAPEQLAVVEGRNLIETAGGERPALAAGGIIAGSLHQRAESGVEPDVEREQIKTAVRYLWGEGLAADDLPQPAPYADGEMPGSLRVAVASNNGQIMDGHFGSCARFLVYQVSRSEARLIDVRSTLDADGAEDRNVARAQLIADCQLVYVQSIGGPAAAKVVRAGVHPVKLPEGGPAAAALARLQHTMDAPPPWLAKVMGVAAASLERFVEDTET